MTAPRTVTIGFMPLVDAALLIVARDEGFAAAHGLDLRLIRQGAWAAIRDKLVFGHFDAAHMLAPAAIAVSTGIGGIETPLAAPLALNRDGNAITASRALGAALRAESDGGTPDASAIALARLIAARAKRGDPPLMVATVYAFSAHTIQLADWLGRAGLRLDRDVALTVVPPPMMVESLASGRIDLFCAGAPWNVLAADAGVGMVLHPCSALAPGSLEKLLVLRRDRAGDGWAGPLAMALREAADWCADPANRAGLARHLAAADALDVPVETIRRVLANEVETAFGRPVGAPWIRLDRAATELTALELDAVATRMAAMGHVADRPGFHAAVAAMPLAMDAPTDA